MENIKIESFKSDRMRRVRQERREKKINKVKLVLFLGAFAIYNYFLIVYILDNLI